MRPITLTAGPYAAASATAWAVSATPVSGTPLTLLTPTLASPRRVLLTAGSEASGRTLVLTGTTWGGAAATETLTVPATTPSGILSVLDYLTLTSALPLGGGWTAAMTLGTSAATTAGSSAWARMDDYGFAPVHLGVEVSGTINYTVEFSDDDPNLFLPQVAVVPSAMTWYPEPNLQGMTVNAWDNFTARPLWFRLTANSYSTTGSAKLIVSQAGGKLG